MDELEIDLRPTYGSPQADFDAKDVRLRVGHQDRRRRAAAGVAAVLVVALFVGAAVVLAGPSRDPVGPAGQSDAPSVTDRSSVGVSGSPTDIAVAPGGDAVFVAMSSGSATIRAASFGSKRRPWR